MSSRSSSLLAATLMLAALLACKTKNGVASSIASKLPNNPAGAGAVKPEDTRCKADAYGTDLKISCSQPFFGSLMSEASTQIQALLLEECPNIKKAGFLAIKVEWIGASDFENAELLLEKDGEPNCTLKPF